MDPMITSPVHNACSTSAADTLAYIRPVRMPMLLLLLAGAVAAPGQQRVLINEVCPSNRHLLLAANGASPDWIELYNPGAGPIDLQGWRIAMGDRQQVLERSMAIPARGHALLHCSAHPEADGAEVGFALPREGGSLILLHPDGMRIADFFTYPAAAADLSIGRMRDGAAEWTWFTAPTPGRANQPPAQGPITGVSKAPSFEREPDGGLRLVGEGTICFTTDGSAPDPVRSPRFVEPLHPEPGSVVRAVAMQPLSLPSDERMLPVTLKRVGPNSIHLALAPADLWSDSIGIYVPGQHQNHTRRGRQWERPAAVLMDDTLRHADARIFGSGSRGAGKRSFKLRADGRLDAFRFADGTCGPEAIVRADASPHAFIRNLLIEHLVLEYGLHVEVQPSEPRPLYLNGAYWGLYRWMPAKDADWLRQRTGAEALDVLEGPEAHALAGSDRSFLRAMQLLRTGASLDSIDALVDTRSLIDLACIDLWTGRADHDLNMRCFRPRHAGGRWRWVLFDLDLWAPPTENSVERMCAASAPEAPYLPQLLAHPGLQTRLLARLTALQAAVFAQASNAAERIAGQYREDLDADHKRWELELGGPGPDAMLRAVQEHAALRPAALFAQLAARTGRRVHEMTIEAPDVSAGILLLEGLPLPPGRHTVRCFSGVPVKLEARAAAGTEFAGWKGVDSALSQVSAPLWRCSRAGPRFRAVAP
jgi:hypothetical protein